MLRSRSGIVPMCFQPQNARPYSSACSRTDAFPQGLQGCFQTQTCCSPLPTIPRARRRFSSASTSTDDITITCPASLAVKDHPIYRAAQACRADVLLSGDLRDFGPFMNHQRRNRPTHCPAGDLSSGPSAPATQALLLRIFTTPGDASPGRRAASSAGIRKISLLPSFALACR
jgi:hypothetical protein